MAVKKLFIFPIKIYQLFISPIIGGNRCCRFTPTCSNYAIEAIEKLGIIKGIIFATLRILSCNPWGGKGYDPVNSPKSFAKKIQKKIQILKKTLNKKLNHQLKSIFQVIVIILTVFGYNFGFFNQSSLMAQNLSSDKQENENNKSNQIPLPNLESLGLDSPQNNQEDVVIKQQKERKFFNQSNLQELIKDEDSLLLATKDKENGSITNSLKEGRKKLSAKRKKEIAIAESKQKEKSKKLQELRRKYLQNDEEEPEDLKVKRKSVNIILPKEKVLPKFINTEIPPPLLVRLKSSENKFHPTIITNEEKVSLMFKSITENRIDDFNSLLKVIGDPNIKNSSGDTLLTFATLMRRYDAMSSLLSKGANPNLENDLGYTSLNIAIEMLDYKATEILINIGNTDINFIDDSGKTYLMQASRLGSLKIVDLLINKGAEINAADNNGSTALALAYKYKQEVVARFLLKFGAKSWIKKDYLIDEKSELNKLFDKWN